MLDNPKIETAEKFNEVFGMATKMKKDGKPTSIDFTKQNVLAILLSKTDSAKTIEPTVLQKNENGELILNFKIVVGQKQSFSTVPNLAIIVDKKVNGNLILKEIK